MELLMELLKGLIIIILALWNFFSIYMLVTDIDVDKKLEGKWYYKDVWEKQMVFSLTVTAILAVILGTNH